MKHKRWQVAVMIAFAWVLWNFYTDKAGSAWQPIEGFETSEKCNSHRQGIYPGFPIWNFTHA